MLCLLQAEAPRLCEKTSEMLMPQYWSSWTEATGFERFGDVVHPVLPSVIRDGGNEVRWLPDTLQSLIICAFRHMAVDIGNWDIFGIPGASFIHFCLSKQFYDVSCSFISPHHS